MKLCIAGKMYSLGATIADTDLFAFDPKKTGITGIDVMSYYYYTGYIFTTLKQYERAIEAFRLALTTPTFLIHQCMINAYKKYLLVCMLSGKPADIPKAASHLSKLFLPKLCSEYKDLYDAMIAVVAFNNVIERCKSTKYKDCKKQRNFL